MLVLEPSVQQPPYSTVLVCILRRLYGFMPFPASKDQLHAAKLMRLRQGCRRQTTKPSLCELSWARGCQEMAQLQQGQLDDRAV